MNRRTFLGAASRAAIIASWPAWLQTAFAEETGAKDPDAGLAVVSEGFRRAQRAGKPLLVLVIPDSDDKKYSRGRTFGEFLNHATRQQHAPLALCEVICATSAQVQKLVPSAGQGNSLLLLIETESLPAEVISVEDKIQERRQYYEFTDKELDALLPPKGRETDDAKWTRRNQARRQLEDRAVNARIDGVAALVAQAVLPNGTALDKRAVQQKNHTPAAMVQSVADKLSGGREAELTAEELDLCAAQVARFAQTAPAKRQSALREQLGAAVEIKLLRSRVPGSKWAQSGGCGTRVEGEQDRQMVACGMGHVPAKSSRFLYFFTK